MFAIQIMVEGVEAFTSEGLARLMEMGERAECTGMVNEDEVGA